ncbi:MAG: aminodeoxychorismate/anthranilate synthase component II [Methanomassiliicoccales archaeon]|nr:aminodeoxychorismate/anthranilate synthase component II [Methanomassiliicoccales archaeon]
MRPHVLLVDNYDSFVYNLAHSLAAAGAEPHVVRNDRLDLKAVEGRYHGIVISPGPGHPANLRDFGMCVELLRTLSPSIPTLGVCLGHQGIAHAFGGKVVRARTPLHGKSTPISHDGRGLFRGLPSPLIVGRYHSLCVQEEDLPSCMEVTACSEDDTVMGLRHRQYPIEGLQFHPESVLTERGQDIVDNFVSSLERGA